MKQEQCINHNNSLLMFLLMFCVISENSVDNHQLQIIIGDIRNYRKKTDHKVNKKRKGEKNVK